MWKANWIGHALRKTRLLKHVIEGKILVQGMGRRGRRRKQLIHLPNLLKLADAPTGLTFNNCTFCPHCMCFVLIREQTAISAPYNMN
jgi:hypothetical protein